MNSKQAKKLKRIARTVALQTNQWTEEVYKKMKKVYKETKRKA